MKILWIVAALLISATAGAQERKVAINFGLTYVPVGNSPVFTVPSPSAKTSAATWSTTI